MEFTDLASSALDQACAEFVPLPQVPEGSDRRTCEPQGPSPLCLAAIIGFTGLHLRGTLGIAASPLGMRRLARSFDVDAEDRRASADCVGEIANLVLGHVKRTWVRHDIDITLSTPLRVGGIEIEVCGQKDGEWFERSLSCGEDQVHVWIDVEVQGDIPVRADSRMDQSLSGGEMLLF